MRKANTRRVAWGHRSLDPALALGSRACAGASSSHGLTNGTWRRISLGEGVLGLVGLDNLVGVAAVQLHELGKIELGLLEDLDLLDEDVLKREDLGALLGDLLGNVVGDANML